MQFKKAIKKHKAYPNEMTPKIKKKKLMAIDFEYH